ncbi:hypothetical protein [Caulobacter sp. NIBR2454]|uniref:hypothetical protein n=1 Tax=Caulobacter sp. NIBR2454 TaxID=3015996 RepID=UPI0022B6AA2B|nr:hypothetical protein [Caulobacter sp. NIBR2454]
MIGALFCMLLGAAPGAASSSLEAAQVGFVPEIGGELAFVSATRFPAPQLKGAAVRSMAAANLAQTDTGAWLRWQGSPSGGTLEIAYDDAAARSKGWALPDPIPPSVSAPPMHYDNCALVAAAPGRQVGLAQCGASNTHTTVVRIGVARLTPLARVNGRFDAIGTAVIPHGGWRTVTLSDIDAASGDLTVLQLTWAPTFPAAPPKP